MLFFMLGANHLGFTVNDSSKVCLYWIVAAILIGILELNAIKGKTGPMTTVNGVIHCSLGLTALMVVLISVLM